MKSMRKFYRLGSGEKCLLSVSGLMKMRSAVIANWKELTRHYRHLQQHLGFIPLVKE